MQISARLARLIFISTSCVLLLLSYVLYLQVKDLIWSYNQINQANVTSLKLEQTLSVLKDAETAQQGFLLTNDSLFLQPYHGAYEKSKKLLSELRSLIGNYPQQHKNLNALGTLVEVRYRSFETVINQYTLPGINSATKKMHLLKGKAAMDSIRYHVDAIRLMEEQLMREREQVKRRHSFLAPLYAFLCIATALGILLFFYDKTMKQLSRSKILLSKLRDLNGKLRQKNYELEMYNKELDSFTYIASHDLKEPLRKISTYTHMIADNESQTLSEKNQLHFTRIQQSVKRMQNLLDDLLMYSQSTKPALAFENVDLNIILQEVTENLSEEIRECKAHIQAGQLPVIKGLPFQIKQLFENLITNSLKYRKETVHPCIHVESSLVDKKDVRVNLHKKSRQYYRIMFTDNGLGFEQAYAEKVFQLFQRVHTSGKHSGTGIGLTICKKIIQNHSGFIKASSEVNVGTLFEIYFPYD
ncbi:MAG TPA: CHASE3 domain-containing protein [Flavisolibacter sp.]|nr:CHASE3 domain-containing protein [Flavisolibacter sp.]